jgi:membrane protein implicated in regulation of membrane protease activity
MPTQTITFGKRAIPLYVFAIPILIIAVIALAIYLGGFNILTGFGVIAGWIFVAPMQWGAISVYNGALVMVGLIVGTSVIIFLYTKRRYLKSTTVQVDATQQPYTARGSQIEEVQQTA